MPRLSSSFTLPDGSLTSDPHVYSGTWLTLIRALEPILETTITAFDPDLVCRRPDGSIYLLPPDVAHLILRLSGSEAPTAPSNPLVRKRGRPRKDATPPDPEPPAPSA